jgi:hypothetical protein
MKRFLLLTTLLNLLFFVLCAVLIGAARALPIAPLLVDEIKRCDRQICVRGVLLDKTTLGDAMKLLLNYPDVIVGRNANAVSASTSRGTIIFASLPVQAGDQATVENIEVDFWTGTNTVYPTLGDFILRYGPPCKVTLHAAVHTVTLYYATLYLNIVSSDGNSQPEIATLSPFLRVGSTISYNDPNMCVLGDSHVDKLWTGFKVPIDYN